MCIITDENNIVVSVSFIPGLEIVPSNYHVYFPYEGALPVVGQFFIDEKTKMSVLSDKDRLKERVLKKLEEITNYVKNETSTEDCPFDYQLLSVIDDQLDEIINVWEY